MFVKGRVIRCWDFLYTVIFTSSRQKSENIRTKKCTAELVYFLFLWEMLSSSNFEDVPTKPVYLSIAAKSLEQQPDIGPNNIRFTAGVPGNYLFRLCQLFIANIEGNLSKRDQQKKPQAKTHLVFSKTQDMGKILIIRNSAADRVKDNI